MKKYENTITAFTSLIFAVSVTLLFVLYTSERNESVDAAILPTLVATLALFVALCYQLSKIGK